MFDTNVFNKILDEEIDVECMHKGKPYFVTHIQQNEIENTKNFDRRTALLNTFHGINKTQVPTESAFYGISVWGGAKWSAEDGVIQEIIERLNAKNRSKKNNGHDALIAETSLKNKYALVTDDSDLRQVLQDMGGIAMSFQEFLSL